MVNWPRNGKYPPIDSGAASRFSFPALCLRMVFIWPLYLDFILLLLGSKLF